MPRNSAAESSPNSVPVDLPPERRLAVAVERYGEAAVVSRSLSLLAGNNEGGDFLLFVGGEHARGILDGAPVLYWPELWGLRALLYVWDESAASTVIGTLDNPAWRVREMGARVVAARELPAASELAELLGDDVPRVRVAAARALGAVGSADDLDRIRVLLKDPEVEVRRGVQQSLDVLRARFPKN
ncbi:HEAT repeat domain-containing protein [Microbacterium sp. A93]|uniref:HEAT repeat domain-containing protein n=1 Tax=unclassified Microbacterium TaxID=2609290 RepID=UPI003F423217